jgi:hypothetical protein
MTHHRTLYVKTETGGRSSWHTIFWGCVECKSLNHVILPSYRLASIPSKSPAALVTGVVEVLREGPMNVSQLLAELRHRRNQAIRHVFSSEVLMAVEYLKAKNVVMEETIDLTEQTVETLKARLWKSKHLGPCPEELNRGVVTKSLVSLYAQKLVGGPEGRRMRLGPVGVLCLQCKYRKVDF